MLNRLSYFGVIALTLVSTAKSQTIDFAVEVATQNSFSISSTEIEILGDFDVSLDAQEWQVVGACKNRPNVKIKILDDFAFSLDATKVKIIAPSSFSISAKKVCITNAGDLDRKTIRKLKLIE